METAVENDIRPLRVVGTAGVFARLGLGPQTRFVLAAPRRYRVRGELITLPKVIGAAHRPLFSTATTRSEQVAAAA